MKRKIQHGWQGTELPCIGEIHWTDLYRYIHRFLSKSGSKGQDDRSPKVISEDVAVNDEPSKVA